ncbi:hypothetical protein BpHYR1_050601 [Brachionus plicatilis]|uniref:Uncharacterized protein n=1 Tax=Brachionus plicatilis TaxID=10195 RepID=A0A3M7SVK0_BRAPC|nr:hypothetical protein BpHYR1_050601 [Brachionus plicatilis]
MPLNKYLSPRFQDKPEEENIRAIKQCAEIEMDENKSIEQSSDKNDIEALNVEKFQLYFKINWTQNITGKALVPPQISWTRILDSNLYNDNWEPKYMIFRDVYGDYPSTEGMDFHLLEKLYLEGLFYNSRQFMGKQKYTNA